MKIVPLSEVCLNIVDCPHATPEWKNEGKRVIRNFNIVDGRLDFSDAYYVDEETFQARTRRAVPKYNNIVFSREAPIGKCALIPEGFVGCLGQRLVLLIVNESVCSPEYLLIALQSPFVLKQIEHMESSGSIVSNFGIGDLKNLQIPIVDNQNAVVNTIKPLNDKIALNNSICSDLESMAKLLYDYWFVQFDFPDENGRPYKSSGGKMVWNDELKREIPEGWTSKKLEELADFGNGINYDKDIKGDKDYKIVNVRNITSSSLLIDKSDLDDICLKQDLSDKYLINKNDILIARSGTPGAVRLLLDNDNALYCGFIIHCLPVDVEDRLYLTFSLKKYEGTNATKTGGSILQNVSQSTLKDLNIVYPNKEFIIKFNNKIQPLIDMMQNIIKENEELLSLRDFLLPLLMNGQVTIE